MSIYIFLNIMLFTYFIYIFVNLTHFRYTFNFVDILFLKVKFNFIQRIILIIIYFRGFQGYFLTVFYTTIIDYCLFSIKHNIKRT